MKILATSYTLKHRALDIYLAGCSGNPHCTNCHNPESWNFEVGEIYNAHYFNKIKTKIVDFDSLIDNIMIFGGEPLDQNLSELSTFLNNLVSLNKTIWLFTRHDLEQVPSFVKDSCHYVKCGRYIEEFKCDNNIQYGISLATSNQHIYKKGVDY